MSKKSKIEWTDKTWNPVTGCTPISEGCQNCYAERMAKRLHAMGQKNYRNGFDVTCHPHMLEQPFHWKKPKRIFVCSMGDLFHKKVPDEFIAAVFGVMAANPQHTFQVLTKRPGNMLRWFERVTTMNEGAPLECAFELLSQEAIYHPDGASGPIHCKYGPNPDAPWPLPNVWLGVTAENQDAADARIQLLMQCPAVVRFVSCEPLLGQIDITQAMYGKIPKGMNGFGFTDGYGYEAMLHWVIAGCESGPKRRKMEWGWARSLQKQCSSANVPFFLKQGEIDGVVEKMPKAFGRVWDQFPEEGKQCGINFLGVSK